MQHCFSVISVGDMPGRSLERGLHIILRTNNAVHHVAGMVELVVHATGQGVDLRSRAGDEGEFIPGKS